MPGSPPAGAISTISPLTSSALPSTLYRSSIVARVLVRISLLLPSCLAEIIHDSISVFSLPYADARVFPGTDQLGCHIFSRMVRLPAWLAALGSPIIVGNFPVMPEAKTLQAQPHFFHDADGSPIRGIGNGTNLLQPI